MSDPTSRIDRPASWGSRLVRGTARTLGAGLLGLAIALLAGGVWAALSTVNLGLSPRVPWAVPLMGLVLWAMWGFLGGSWGPKGSAEARRRLLRAVPVSRAVYLRSFVAGALAIVALAGLWILAFDLFPMRANLLPDFSRYPWWTVALAIGMGSLVSPLSEEAGLRGYCQGMLERRMSGPAAIALSSLFFAVGHAPLHGFLLPKLAVYYLAGVVFGTIAYLTRSTLPGIPVHILGDVTFFTLVWPRDAARHTVWQGGADAWFWTHVTQAVVFTALAIVAFRRLGRMAPARS